MDTDSFVFEIQESTKLWLDKQSREKKGRIKTKNAILSKKTGIKTIWYKSKSSGV